MEYNSVVDESYFKDNIKLYDNQMVNPIRASVTSIQQYSTVSSLTTLENLTTLETVTSLSTLSDLETVTTLSSLASLSSLETLTSLSTQTVTVNLATGTMDWTSFITY